MGKTVRPVRRVLKYSFFSGASRSLYYKAISIIKRLVELFSSLLYSRSNFNLPVTLFRIFRLLEEHLNESLRVCSIF